MRTESWPFGFTGTLVEDVCWAGARFNAVVEPNWTEIHRRETAGLASLPDVGLLDALGSLPRGIEVAWDAVDPVRTAILDNAPSGVLRSTRSDVRVDLQPAVELRGIFATSRSWTAIQRLGPLVMAAPTGVVCRQLPRDRAMAVSEATKFGIGLAHWLTGGADVLAPPHLRMRPSLARSLLLELLYDALLRRRDFSPSARP